jgi:hypothetical protein
VAVFEAEEGAELTYVPRAERITDEVATSTQATPAAGAPARGRRVAGMALAAALLAVALASLRSPQPGVSREPPRTGEVSRRARAARLRGFADAVDARGEIFAALAMSGDETDPAGLVRAAHEAYRQAVPGLRDLALRLRGVPMDGAAFGHLTRLAVTQSLLDRAAVDTPPLFPDGDTPDLWGAMLGGMQVRSIPVEIEGGCRELQAATGKLGGVWRSLRRCRDLTPAGARDGLEGAALRGINLQGDPFRASAGSRVEDELSLQPTTGNLVLLLDPAGWRGLRGALLLELSLSGSGRTLNLALDPRDHDQAEGAPAALVIEISADLLAPGTDRLRLRIRGVESLVAGEARVGVGEVFQRVDG